MDIKKFKLFLDVAETNNFTKSGDRLGYTQSGVSHILKSLEEEVGFPLFIRSKHGVTLTKSAKQILPTVRSLLSMYDSLEQNINEIHGVEIGSITIATFQSISISWLPSIIHRFQKTYPGINIKLMEGGTDDIVNWVENDIADFGFLSKQRLRSLDWISLYEDPLMAIVPIDYPTNKNDDAISINEFQGQSFIMTAMGTDYDVHSALSEASVIPDVRFTSKDDHAIISMVSNHLGYSILPRLSLNGVESQVKVLPLSPNCSRNLGIAVKSKETMSPAAAKFIGLTKEMIPELNDVSCTF